MGQLDSLAPTIKKLIDQFGTTATLVFDNPGEYDVAAGKTEASESPVTVKVLFDKVKTGEINQGLAQSGDRKAWVGVYEDFPRQPRPSDRLEYGTDENGDPVSYRVTASDPILLTDEVGLFGLYLRI
jgi:hypothetical protein